MVTAPDTALVEAVRTALRAAADPAAAEPMRAYMKSEMPFLGVPKPARTAALEPVFAEHRIDDGVSWRSAVLTLWDGAEFREERYAAVTLAQLTQYAAFATRPDALDLYDHLVVTGAWWDFVDEVAIRSVGPVLRGHHDAVAPVVRRWARDADRWRRRTAVICQIGSKAEIDVDLLAEAVQANLGDDDFFLRKGIGWALRQHARVDPEWVRRFVAAHEGELSALSRREALRNIDPPSIVTRG
ncbi:DNA alkylation repair protein [Jiangella ureilytica]|uniref:DNA alkylation repair protein n=1 Tax=Jiangella ureilytica TaxID=2530374 RepID=A0A4R4RFM2_9ACTN|nr:DNA alkylation repair protein [Jiangella ureilytica]TDC48178.1 DNA alkylation repair protein [Jiangella ureilytica]